jgi:cytochrome c oxidase subunit 2|tara:strand:+ start:351 stop:854 length:504 start_codon:yes stop_codon:yes gene_type:complete
MKKIYFILAVLSLFLIAACSQQPAAPVGQGTPVGDAPTQAVPAPGVDTVDETVVVEDPAPPPEDESLPTEVEPPAPAVNEIEVIAKQWEFIPNPITVSKGDNVRLKIKSIDVAHGIAIPDFGISQRLNPGETEIVEFTADREGSFGFFCNVACGSGHRSMTGTLIVE